MSSADHLHELATGFAESLPKTAGLAAVLGVLSHLVFFGRGEFMSLAPLLFLSLFAIPSVLFAVLTVILSPDNVTIPPIEAIVRASVLTGTVTASYLSSLFTSIFIYRSFLHPLRRFPGPFWARSSQFYISKRNMERAQGFRILDSLHKQYGDFVRVGPDLISVADPVWVDRVHGPRSRFTKSEAYEAEHGVLSLHQMSDRAMHDKRRRHGWDKAFQVKSLRDYDARVLKYTDILLRKLESYEGRAVDATKWFNYFSYDIMGDLAFARSFNALEDGEYESDSHYYIRLLHSTTLAAVPLLMIPWAVRILTSLLPDRFNPRAPFVKYCKDCIEERRAREPEKPDVMSHILEAGPFFPPSIKSRQQEGGLLVGDARLLIVAGSDTTATTLTYFFYELCREPSLAGRLRDELKEHDIESTESSEFSIVALQNLPFLNAVINETLRLHPPVPSGVPRNVPHEGVVMNGIFTPGGTRILEPIYTVHRSLRAFLRPNDFVPERWTTKPEMIIDKNAFFPFSTGRYSCIGKQLALNELRSVITKLILKFDVSFAKGETGRALIEDSKDAFTMVNMPLYLCFTEREAQ